MNVSAEFSGAAVDFPVWAPSGTEWPADDRKEPAVAVAQRRRSERRQRRRLEQEIREALHQEVLVLHYQPRLELGSFAICGAEALLRWPHRTRGAVSPGLFVPIADQSGLIVEIGGWALRTACREAACWAGGAATVSVNIAARQLGERALLGQVAAALEASGLAPERLELALTEAVLVADDSEMLLALSAIRDLGVGLALQDFGNHYGSLTMLRRLPLTTVQLHRSLVRGLPDDREHAAIVGATVRTAHALGLAVVADGVETEPQRAFLAGSGCDFGQGYLFGAAMPADRLRAELAGSPRG